MFRFRLFLPWVICAAFLWPAPVAQAVGGKLSAADVAVPATYPKGEYPKIQAALRRPDVKFLGGSWVNAYTTLRYGGVTRSLNQFLEQLQQCPGVRVNVTFFRSETEAADWLVHHDGHNNHFNVRVNLGSTQIRLEDLVISARRN